MGRTLLRSTVRAAVEALESRCLLSGGIQQLLSAGSAGGSVPPEALLPSQGNEGIWVDFDLADGRGTGAVPTIELAPGSSSGVLANVTVPGAWLEEVRIADVPLGRLALPDAAQTAQPGQPLLPVLRRLITVPEEASISVEWLGQPQYHTLASFGGMEGLLPAQLPLAKVDGAVEAATLQIDAGAYTVDAFSPEAQVRIIEMGQSGGQRLALLEVSPIQYNPVQGVLAVYTAMTISIGFDGLTEPGGSLAVPIGAATSTQRLMVIAADELAGSASLSNFAAVKAGAGWSVEIVSTATAGSSAQTIRQFIRSRYDDPASRPGALLLVGDTNLIPQWIGASDSSIDTDLYYACMDDGDDWQPEFAVGRFSVRDEAQLNAAVAKTIAWQTAGPADWMHKIAFVAGVDNAHITEATHNWAIANVTGPLAYASDRLYVRESGATTAQVSAAFNDGRVLGVYSGHGSAVSWADGPQFTQNDVLALSNADAFPFILSFACSTGDYAIDESFAETWQRADSKGAVGVLAASTLSYWTEDDIFEKRLFRALLMEEIAAFGDSINRAKQLYLEHFGPTTMTRRYFEMYNLFGDPTLMLLPQDLRFTSGSVLPTGFAGEAYAETLGAAGGEAPYAWTLAGGNLPEGLTLDAAGRISGTPLIQGEAMFRVALTDASGASHEEGFTLTISSRLRIQTQDLPLASVGHGFSVALAGAGGESPYTWSIPNAGEYEELTGTGVVLTSGVARNWRADDGSWTLALPWAFPFYGREYTSVHVSSNGFLDFTSSEPDYNNTTARLLGDVRIAPFWDDLATDGPGEDIFVSSAADAVAIQWSAHVRGGTEPVQFEAILKPDGAIQFNYGSLPVTVAPTVGISAGDGVNSILSAFNNAAHIDAGTRASFQYRPALPLGLSLDPVTGVLSGIPRTAGDWSIQVHLQDASTPPQIQTRTFSLRVLALPPLALTLPLEMHEGDGVLSGSISIPEVLGADLTVTLSGGNGELVLPQAVVIPAGSLSASFEFSVADNDMLDGTRQLTLTATADGYTAADLTVTVFDNEAAILSVVLPESLAEGQEAQGQIIASAPPASDVVIRLSASDGSELLLPATVLLPAGQTAVAFPLLAPADTLIDGAQPVIITAAADAWQQGSAAVAVEDVNRTMSLWLMSRLSEAGGQAVNAARIVLGGTTTADLTVELATSGKLAAPSSILIPAGRNDWWVTLALLNDTAFDGVTPAAVTTSAEGFEPATAATLIEDDEVHHFAFDPIGPSVRGSETFAITITARDVNDSVITFYNGTVDLEAVGSAGPIPVEINPSASSAVSTTSLPLQPFVPGAKSGSALVLGEYHTYETLTIELAALASAYPEILQLYSIGRSVQGREIWAVKLTDNPAAQEDEPEFAYVGTLHGNESLGTEMCLWLLDLLTSGYGADPRLTSLVDNTEIWIVPVANPDGLTLGTRANAGGVDLNRNFPEGSTTELGNLMQGPPLNTIGRQPETAALMQWSASQRFVLSASLHTGALLVNYPYDRSEDGSVPAPTPDDELFRHVAELYSFHNPPMWNSDEFPHGVTNGASWYVIAGGLQDWSYRYAGNKHVTIELSEDYQPDAALLGQYWLDNRESMLSFMEAVHMGVRGTVTDRITGLPVQASVRVVGRPQSIFTDPDVGDYHQMLLPGVYDLIFSAPGYGTLTVNGVDVAAGSATRLDVSLVPAGIVGFTNGQWTGDIAIMGADTGVTLTANDRTIGAAGASNTFDVVAGPVDHFAVSPIASPQIAGAPFAVEITARDEHGLIASGFSGSVRLRTSDGTPLTPATTGSFVGGVWRGMVTIGAPAAGLSLVVEMDDGLHGSSDSLVIEANSSPLLELGPDRSIIGQEFDLAGLSVLDANALDAWKATVQWSADGPAEPQAIAADGSFRLQHVYPSHGTYTITVTVIDRAGAAATDSLTITVQEAQQLDGTEGPDTLLLRLDEAGTTVKVFSSALAEGEPAWTMPMAQLSNLLFAGLGGDDLLIIDPAHGNPLPPGGLAFSGGAGFDRILILTSASNTVSLDGQGASFGERQITLLGMEAIEITGTEDDDELVVEGQPPAAVGFAGGAGADTVRFRAGRHDVNWDAAAERLVVEAGANVTIRHSQHIESLHIGTAARLEIAAGGDRAIFASAVTIEQDGELDLMDNALVIHAGPGQHESVRADMSALVANGSDNKEAGGPKVTSSAVARSTGLAVAINDSGSGPLVGRIGSDVLGTDCVIVKFGLLGDVDLNGRIDGDDYFAVDRGFLLQLPTYQGGDLDYSGAVDAADYFAIDIAFLSQPVTAALAAAMPQLPPALASDPACNDEDGVRELLRST